MPLFGNAFERLLGHADRGLLSGCNADFFFVKIQIRNVIQSHLCTFLYQTNHPLPRPAGGTPPEAVRIICWGH
jgi:hypothetical protein